MQSRLLLPMRIASEINAQHSYTREAHESLAATLAPASKSAVMTSAFSAVEDATCKTDCWPLRIE